MFVIRQVSRKGYIVSLFFHYQHNTTHGIILILRRGQHLWQVCTYAWCSSLASPGTPSILTKKLATSHLHLAYLPRFNLNSRHPLLQHGISNSNIHRIHRIRTKSSFTTICKYMYILMHALYGRSYSVMVLGFCQDLYGINGNNTYLRRLRCCWMDR